MVVELKDQEEWELSSPEGEGLTIPILFASVSAPEKCIVWVWLNDRLVDKVNLAPGTPHSWWSQTSQSIAFKNALAPGDVLKVKVDGSAADLRIDLDAIPA